MMMRAVCNSSKQMSLLHQGTTAMVTTMCTLNSKPNARQGRRDFFQDGLRARPWQSRARDSERERETRRETERLRERLRVGVSLCHGALGMKGLCASLIHSDSTGGAAIYSRACVRDSLSPTRLPLSLSHSDLPFPAALSSYTAS